MEALRRRVPRCGRARARRGCWGAAAGLLVLAGLLASGAHEEPLSRLLLPLLLPPAEPPDGSPAPPPPGAFPLEPEPCGAVGGAPFLLVLVTSAPGHAEQRAAVRETWGGAREAAGLPVRTVFLLGEPSGGEARAQAGALRAEAARHGDVLQARFRDTYRNLTLKTLAGLGWARSRCPGAHFVVKADDDVFLNLPGLARALDAIPVPARPGAYLGRVHWRVHPDRDPASRHYVPAALYPPTAFPPYCSGTAYALSGEAVGAVLRASAREPLLPLEDVFVGLCARRAGLAPRHLPGLSGGDGCPPDPCCLRRALLSAHGVPPDDMRRAWRAPRRLLRAPPALAGPSPLQGARLARRPLSRPRLATSATGGGGRLARILSGAAKTPRKRLP